MPSLCRLLLPAVSVLLDTCNTSSYSTAPQRTHVQCMTPEDAAVCIQWLAYGYDALLKLFAEAAQELKQ